MAPATAIPREYVPIASTLAIQPFVAAVFGYLRQKHEKAEFRLTVHRVMGDENQKYLQQLCNYFGQPGDGGKGRIFPIQEGIIGAAYRHKSIWRTKEFNSDTELLAELTKAISHANDHRNPSETPKSFLAIPFLSKVDSNVVLIFYADSNLRNTFGYEEQQAIVSMANGFCLFADSLVDPLTKIPGLSNFPFPPLPHLFATIRPVYSIQEEQKATVPQFTHLRWFNFEATI